MFLKSFREYLLKWNMLRIRYRNPIINSNDVVIAISQSETADMISLSNWQKNAVLSVFKVCNVVGSSISREKVRSYAGPEIVLHLPKLQPQITHDQPRLGKAKGTLSLSDHMYLQELELTGESKRSSGDQRSCKRNCYSF
jgi:glucosamine--fructose-6-phosphate aminotransferase (isomerizing)